MKEPHGDEKHKTTEALSYEDDVNEIGRRTQKISLICLFATRQSVDERAGATETTTLHDERERE